MSENKATIFYIYDPLCGWCYGFSPVIKKFYEQQKDNYNFQVLSGGMVTGARVGPISQVASYIKDAYKQVEEKTGVKFGQAFIDDLMETNEIFTSLPGAQAMALFRSQMPEKQIEFAGRIQQAIYEEGLPPADWTTYGKCAADYGMQEEEFAEKMQHPKLVELANEEFNVVQQWGVQGFPTVVIQKEQKAYPIARGYTSYENLEAMRQKVEEL